MRAATAFLVAWTVGCSPALAPPAPPEEADWICGGVGGGGTPGGLSDAGTPILQRAFVSANGAQVEGEVPTEVPVRYSIPIRVRAQSEVVAAKMVYKEQPFDVEWQSLTGKVSSGTVSVTIPCVEAASLVRFYLMLFDANGDLIDTIGTRKEPLTVEVVQQMRSGLPDGSTLCGRQTSDESRRP